MIVNKLIAVDFDGVLFKNDYPNVGEPIIENIEKVKKLGEHNSLILWTCREKEPLKKAIEACEKYGLKFISINSNPDWLIAAYDGENPRKIGADYFIDDRNINLNDIFKPNDVINHPSHYTQGKIECISYIEDKNLNYHLGNAIKYITRAGHKDPTKKIEDLKKAVWYINREIERSMTNEEK